MEATRRLATLRREQHAAEGIIAAILKSEVIRPHTLARLDFWKQELAELTLAIAELSAVLKLERRVHGHRE